MNTGFTLLWSKTLYSSLWINASKEAKLLFFTLLMMKDSDGVIISSLPGFVNMSKLTFGEVESALVELLSKDDFDSSGVEGGIRIRKIQGGWQIVNHDLYRFSTEAKREFWKAQKAEQRAKKVILEAQRKKKSNKAQDNGSTYFPETEGEKRAKEGHLGLAPGTLSRDEDIPF